jgi:hypothetical protein
MAIRHTIYKIDYKGKGSAADYSRDYKSMCRRYEYKAKIDDGQGGTGWLFFESREDYDLWKRTR